jgi:hypothetical protein
MPSASIRPVRAVAFDHDGFLKRLAEIAGR